MHKPVQYSLEDRRHPLRRSFTTSLLTALAVLLLCSTGSSQSQYLGSTGEILFVLGAQTLGNTRTFGLDIADIDLDGDNDVFITNYLGPCRLWINVGDRTFIQSDQNFYASPSVPSGAHDAAVADLNGDNYPDVFIAFHNLPSKIYLNDTLGGFYDNGQQIGSFDDFPQTVQLIDVDNDSDLDALMLLSNAPSGILFNNGEGIFTESGVGYGGTDANAMLLAHLNDDVYPDLYMSLRSAPNEVWFNDGSGAFSNTGQALDDEISDVTTGDVDGDGDLDIVSSEAGQINIWLNQNHSGTFVAGSGISEGAIDLALLDADSDGDPDIVTAHPENGNALWINDGTGSFTSLGTIFGMQQVLSIACGNLDSDGDSEVVFGQLEGTGGNRIYYNESTQSGVSEGNEGSSLIFRVNSNFPNPFNSSTTIPYEVQYQTEVAFQVLDILGRIIVSMHMGIVDAGYHTVTWNGRNQAGQPVPTGAYFCEMVVEKQCTDTIRMLVVK